MFTVFEKLGGVNVALDALQRRANRRPSARALKHWRFVRTLPTWAVLALMQECLERRIPFSDEDFHLAGFEEKQAS